MIYKASKKFLALTFFLGMHKFEMKNFKEYSYPHISM
jgi:hypothetical protein